MRILCYSCLPISLSTSFQEYLFLTVRKPRCQFAKNKPGASKLKQQWEEKHYKWNFTKLGLKGVGGGRWGWLRGLQIVFLLVKSNQCNYCSSPMLLPSVACKFVFQRVLKKSKTNNNKKRWVNIVQEVAAFPLWQNDAGFLGGQDN